MKSPRCLVVVLVCFGVPIAFAQQANASPKRPKVDMAAMQEAIGSGRNAQLSPAASAYAHYLQARLFHHEGEHRLAVDELRLALATDEVNVVVMTQLAEQFARASDSARAEGQLRRVLDLDPRYAPAHVLLGRILLEGHQNNRAKTHLQKAISLGPALAEPSLLMTQLFLEEGLVDDAVKVVEALDVAAHGEPVGLRRLGLALASGGDAARAERLLSKAVERDAGDFQSWLALAKLHDAQAAFEKAFEAWEHAAQCEPENHVALLSAGRAALRLNKGAEAQGYFDAALGLSRDAEMAVQVALQYLASGLLSKAQAVLDASRKSSPEPRLHFYAGLVHERQRHFKEALEAYIQVDASNETIGSVALLHAAWCHAMLGRPVKANQLLKEVSRRSPLPDEMAVLSARIAERQGENKRAEGLYLESLTQKISSGTIQGMVDFFARRNRLPEVIGVLGDQLKKNPENEALRFGLAAAHEKNGEFQKAIALMEPLVKAQRVSAMNFVAYGLAQRGLDLGTAEALARKVNLEQPHVPAFLDTLGLVLLKQRNLEEAKTLFEEATRSEPDPTVLEHFSGLAEAQGDFAGAQRLLRQAVELLKADPASAESSDQLARLESKLKFLSKDAPAK
jgi:tetratricopeptide (TPR) repeat protein